MTVTRKIKGYSCGCDGLANHHSLISIDAALSGFDGSGSEAADFPDTTSSGRVAQHSRMDGLPFIPEDARHCQAVPWWYFTLSY